MTDEQKNHIEGIVADVSRMLYKKYAKGQDEHGGNVWEKPAFNCAAEEVTDLNVYLLIVQGHISNCQVLVAQTQRLFSSGDVPMALKTLDSLELALRNI